MQGIKITAAELGVSECSDVAGFSVKESRQDRTDRKAKRIDRNTTRQFVVWDGEGAHDEERNRQDFVLFGCFDGTEHEFLTAERLRTTELLEFIVSMGERYPDAWHVAFAFDYDANMIVRNLPPHLLQHLKVRGFVRYNGFRIEHLPRKWFRVTKYGPGYLDNPADKITVTIFDVWGFWQSSFLAALRTTVAAHPLMQEIEKVEAGKNARNTFTYKDIEFIREYWKVENRLFHVLVNQLRDMLYRVGFNIEKWYGPGAIANNIYRSRNIKSHKADCGPEVYDAARFAYAGGRFECFRVGRHGVSFGYDINSAYPAGISRLPSLSEGNWSHVVKPDSVVEFGVYHVRLTMVGKNGAPLLSGVLGMKQPAPLFHRDAAGNISFPWNVDGWYWSPEIQAMAECMPRLPGLRVEIVEGWEYTGWTTRPFAFIQEMYDERRALKAAKDGAQMALKLGMNSMYGKQAQRVGWERTGSAPTWHQLEWSGWVTSFARATIYRLISRIPFDKLIAVETDGVYTTCSPGELGITDSKELGGWEVSSYEELIYLQSGVYAKKDADGWSVKFRGLDKDSFGSTPAETAEAFQQISRELLANEPWPKLTGNTTRFIGYQHALFREIQGQGPMKKFHCQWETEPRELSIGTEGKRIHVPANCDACAAGKSAAEIPHTLVIRTDVTEGFVSYRHDIPWLDTDLSTWRKRQDEKLGLIAA